MMIMSAVEDVEMTAAASAIEPILNVCHDKKSDSSPRNSQRTDFLERKFSCQNSETPGLFKMANPNFRGHDDDRGSVENGLSKEEPRSFAASGKAGNGPASDQFYGVAPTTAAMIGAATWTSVSSDSVDQCRTAGVPTHQDKPAGFRGDEPGAEKTAVSVGTSLVLSNELHVHKCGVHEAADQQSTKSNVDENEPGQAAHEFQKFDEMGWTHIGLILLSLGLVSFLFAIEQTIVATSVTSIGNALHVEGSLTWITTSYLLTATILQPITGRLADAIGTKRLLIIELWVFVVGNIIAGVSRTLVQLVAGRLISGLGGAGLLSLSMTIISQLTNERQRGSYLNLINVVFVISDAMGPVVGSAFAKSGNWRWIFLFNAPFGPVITLILLKALRLPPSPFLIRNIKEISRKLDITGMILLMATLTFLVIVMNLGGQELPWNSPAVIGMSCAAAVSFIGFVLAESKAKIPVAPLYLFKQWKWRNVPLIVVIRCLLFFHIFATTFYLPIYLQLLGISSMNAAALVIPFLSAAALSSTLTNSASQKFGHVRPLFLLGMAILPVGLGLMSTLDERSSLGRVIGYAILSGFGFGSGAIISLVIAQVGLPPEEMATVTALVNTSPTLGAVLGVGVVGAIVNNSFRHAITVSMPSSSQFNLNDVVGLLRDSVDDQSRRAVIKAYMHAWKVGYWTLTGIAVMQFVLSLFLRPVTFDSAERSR